MSSICLLYYIGFFLSCRFFLRSYSPAEAIEEPEKGDHDIDEDDQGEERVRNDRVWASSVARNLQWLIRLKLKHGIFIC